MKKKALKYSEVEESVRIYMKIDMYFDIQIFYQKKEDRKNQEFLANVQ